MADCGLLLRAVFISELKNRFRCIVRLNGEEILCYVPSSCKLNNFIELVGRSVLVKKMASSTGLEYTLFALETPRGLVLLNLAMANEVLEYQIQRRFFSFLGSRKHVRREVIIDGYKSDLYIDDTDTVIEIKTVLSLNRIAHFPSVRSQRSIEQLRKIVKLLDAGHHVCYLFVSLGPQIRKICLDYDEKYNELFAECVDKGMLYYGCALKTLSESTVVSSKVVIQR